MWDTVKGRRRGRQKKKVESNIEKRTRLHCDITTRTAEEGQGGRGFL